MGFAVQRVLWGFVAAAQNSMVHHTRSDIMHSSLSEVRACGLSINRAHIPTFDHLMSCSDTGSSAAASVYVSRAKLSCFSAFGFWSSGEWTPHISNQWSMIWVRGWQAGLLCGQLWSCFAFQSACLDTTEENNGRETSNLHHHHCPDLSSPSELSQRIVFCGCLQRLWVQVASAGAMWAEFYRWLSGSHDDQWGWFGFAFNNIQHMEWTLYWMEWDYVDI